MAKNNEKLLLFDVDGVIVDSFNEVYLEVKKFIEDLTGNELTEEEYRKLYEGNPLEQIFSLVGATKLLKVKDEMKSFLNSYKNTKIFDGMEDVLRELNKDHTLVVITSSLLEVVTDKFDETGLSELFAGFLGPRAAIHKDKKIKMALKEFGFAPEQAIFISDTSGDIVEAKKTGVATIGVTWGYHSKATVESSKPDQIAETPAELKKLLT